MKKIGLLVAILTIAGIVQARDALTVCIADCAAVRLGNEQSCYWGTLPWEQDLYRSCMNGAQVIYDQCAADCHERYDTE